MKLGLTVGLLVASTSAAFAQAAPDPASAPPPPAAPATLEPPPPEHPGVDRGVLDDARAGTSFLSPTALTAPAGTWWFSDVDLVLASAGYAVTNEFQVSLTTIVPITTDVPLTGFFQAKLQVLKAGRLRLAAQGVLAFLQDKNSDGSDSQLYFAGDVGGAATLCFDDGCYSNGSLYVGAGFAQGGNSSVPLLVSGSLALRVSRHVKLVGEVDTGYVVGQINESSGGALVWYGLRFTSRNIGADIGFVKPFIDNDGDDNDGLALGLPYIGFTYRGD
jgi:hypothetical protein